MEIKKFNEYSKDEQVALLFHWWHYYGKLLVSFEDMIKFNDLVAKDPEFVKNAALVAYARGESSQDLVRALRGDFEKYRNEIFEITTTIEFEDVEEELEKRFIEETVCTYNNPEPSIPMSEETMIESIMEMLGIDSKNVHVIKISNSNGEWNIDEACVRTKEDNAPVLTSKKVHDIYRECLFAEEELTRGVPTVDFTIGEGVMQTCAFNSERLAKRKKDIVAMIDELENIEQAPSFTRLCMDKHGRQWADDHGTMDLLVQLGMATEVIEFPFPRDCWPAFGGVPLVARVHTKDNEDLRVHKPKEFKKVKEQLDNGTYKKGAK